MAIWRHNLTKLSLAGLALCAAGCQQGFSRQASLPYGAQALSVPTYSVASGSPVLSNEPIIASMPAGSYSASPSASVISSGPVASISPLPPSAVVTNPPHSHVTSSPPHTARISPSPTAAVPSLQAASPAATAFVPVTPKASPSKGPVAVAPNPMSSSAVVASKPMDNPIPNVVKAAPAPNPIPTNPAPAKPIPSQPTPPPIAKAPVAPMGGDPFSGSSNPATPPAAAPAKIPPVTKAAPSAIPPASAAKLPMKETSLAWAPWPYSPAQAPVPKISDKLAGARSLIPYRAATRPGSPAERVYRSRLAKNSAIASATGAVPGQSRKLIYRGGKTLRDLAYVNLYLGGEDQWKQSDVLKIDKSIQAAMTDARLNEQLKPFFNGKNVTSVALPSHPLSGSVPKKISRSDLHQTLKSLHAQGYLEDYDLEVTVFNILVPSSVVLTDDADDVDSLSGLAGYHGSVKADRDRIYYTSVAFAEKRPDGKEIGIPVFSEGWKNTVAALYHQLQEVRTNPDSEEVLNDPSNPKASEKLGWTTDAGEEIGDLLLHDAQNLSAVIQEVPLADGSGTVPIQRLIPKEGESAPAQERDIPAIIPMNGNLPDISTDIPKELPSALPAIPKDIPSEIPTKIPSEIPSVVPSAFSGDLSSEMPAGIPAAPPINQLPEIPAAMPSEIPAEIPAAPPSQIPSELPGDIPAAPPGLANPFPG